VFRRSPLVCCGHEVQAPVTRLHIGHGVPATFRADLERALPDEERNPDHCCTATARCVVSVWAQMFVSRTCMLPTVIAPTRLFHA
jgi:hypothetical protein